MTDCYDYLDWLIKSLEKFENMAMTQTSNLSLHEYPMIIPMTHGGYVHHSTTFYMIIAIRENYEFFHFSTHT